MNSWNISSILHTVQSPTFKRQRGEFKFVNKRMQKHVTENTVGGKWKYTLWKQKQSQSIMLKCTLCKKVIGSVCDFPQVTYWQTEFQLNIKKNFLIERTVQVWKDPLHDLQTTEDIQRQDKLRIVKKS